MGFSLEDALKTDHLVKFITERGVFKGGSKYKMEDYNILGFKEPERGQLESILDAIEEKVAETTRSAFDQPERNSNELTISTPHSSHLTLSNQTDYDSVAGPLAFHFEGHSGPFQPYHYKPGDIVGSADKPHYGIGGFHEYYPVRHILTDPAVLIIDYENNEITDSEEGTLAIYRWNMEDRDWDYIGGELDIDNNTVTTEITQLGGYTLAPAMPAGDVEWEDPQVQQVGQNLIVSLTTMPLSMNNGDPVPDGMIFHVISAYPYAYTPEGVMPFGEILSNDAQPDVQGNQVEVENGRIQLELEYPESISNAARIILFSDIGTTIGDEVISLSVQ